MLTGPQRAVLVCMARGRDLVRTDARLYVRWSLRRLITQLGATVRANVGPLLAGGYIERVTPRPGQPPYEDVYQLTEKGRTSAFPPGQLARANFHKETTP